jgi:hypothetical protein
MSLLQAARAFVLGLPLESAYSWGLNRAILIAAAKRGFKGGGERSGTGEGPVGAEPKRKDTYFLGDDMAFMTKKKGVMFFTFGGKVQTTEEFDKRVKARFGETFPAAWKEALDYVKRFDRDVLLSREDFYGRVYKPVRDEFAGKWTVAGSE